MKNTIELFHLILGIYISDIVPLLVGNISRGTIVRLSWENGIYTIGL